MREWAEVPYVPTRKYEDKESRPYRYVAIRVRRQQGDVFEDGSRIRHFAVVTNLGDMLTFTAASVIMKKAILANFSFLISSSK